MKILYHAQGKTRKELADAISTITGAAKMYQGIPSYAYEIDCFTVDRDGNLNFDDSTETKKNTLSNAYYKAFLSHNSN